MVKMRAGRTMVGKDTGSSKPSSTKRKKSPQGGNSPSLDLIIVKVSFQGKISGEPANIQARSSISYAAKQKAVAMKTTIPLPKRRKMPMLNEEQVDNNLVDSPKQSLERMSSPALVTTTVLADDPEESSKKICFVCPCFCVLF